MNNAAGNFFSGPSSRMTVDLDAIAQNWLLLKKKLQNGADCAGVVKADSYGLGAAAVSRALFRQGCRHFFVAQYAEGLKVRAALSAVAGAFPHSPVSDAPVVVDAPTIYVLEGPCGVDTDEFAQSGLVPVLNSPADIAQWRAAAAKLHRKLPAVLHIDTGMNRLGLNGTEVAALAADAAIWAALDIRYAMSHLACADEPAHAMNAAQLTLFRQLTAALGRPLRFSFANSSGIFLGPDYHFDLARPGCAIYGINPVPDKTNPMRGTVLFEGRILQNRIIDRQGTVGYGAGYAVDTGTKCATVSIGYADGYLRSLTGRGKVYIGGVACDVIGRVSMDSIVVDTNHLPVPPAPGTWAEIIGPHQSVDDVAAQAGTIGYEIFTGLGLRTPRHYIGDSL
jgi:alanine racemase